MVAAPQPPPVDVNDVQRRIGQESILRGFGLSGSEPGLIFDTPQELVASAQRIVAARGAAAQPQQGVDHDELVAEAARRQGMVIPHRDGGRAAPFNQPVTSQDVARLAWGYSSKRNPPARLRQQIESMRQNGRAPTVSTGETGYQPTPENFARISSGQNPR
jgi:hypothetical protein